MSKLISFIQPVVFTGKKALLGKTVNTRDERDTMLHLNPETGEVTFDSGYEYCTVPEDEIQDFVKLAKAQKL